MTQPDLVVQVTNPNSTGSMTDLIGRSARAVAGPGVSVVAVGSPDGPACIETAVDEVHAAPGVLRMVADGELRGVDGHVIACFGDPGLDAARLVARGPVVGIAEAAMRSATFLGRRFSVVTTAATAVPGIEDLAFRYGVAGACAGVHASGVGVLELGTDPAAYDRVLAAASAAVAADRSDVVVLGCAGMADWAARLGEDLGRPVVDGVAAAVGTVVALVRSGAPTTVGGRAVAGASPQPFGQPV
ncbi:allantoin racemase [Nocardioides zeae]|uniref:Allantoin racemase n=1 Tax=Nocardioides zeae TaxID=1457234 RepID=A0ACC6IJS8_9ACTN|nr:aspartate/glutamate racemase family protein [Nocardioides zeae]MDR6173518.1 allantoin racemase [Nocardioides zeae]MDR6210924.1 allantoin racemase [Nocardioides zeae]